MAYDRLALYNASMLLAGERFLASLAENIEPRRLLDHVWNTNGVQYLLEQAQWWFAMRAVQIDYDPNITPPFGYSKAFNKPIDFVTMSAVCSDEFFRTPLTAYSFEGDEWYADITPIYVKYVSNDAAWGGDLSKWPATFCDFAAAYFASRIISKLSGDRSAQQSVIFGPPGQPEQGLLHKTLHIAKNKAAITQPTQFIAQGNWSRARRGRRGGYNDRGNSGTLLG